MNAPIASLRSSMFRQGWPGCYNRNAPQGWNLRGEIVAGNDVSKIAPKKAKRKSEVDWQEIDRFACESREQDIRDELDPQSDLSKVLDRVLTLATRARQLNTDDVFVPGLETIERIASDLRILMPPYTSSLETYHHRRADIKERHKDARDKARLPVCPILEADRILGIVSKIEGTVGDGYVSTVRGWLLGSMPRTVTDDDILNAVVVYRKPHTGVGRPGRSAGDTASDKDRAMAAKSLVEDTGDESTAVRRLREARKTDATRRQRVIGKPKNWRK